MTARDSFERPVRGLLHLILRAYPRAFRREYGRDIEETNLDRYRAARRESIGRAVRVVAAIVMDAAIEGARERLSSSLQVPSMFYWQDVRYALRLLRRSPLFTALTVVVLSGGMGLSIFTFSFLHTAIVRPLPLDGGDRIVRVQQANGRGLDAAYLALMRPDITALSEIGEYTTRELIIGSDGARRALGATAAEWNIFQFTRTPPALGRGFLPGDAMAGAEPVIVLGHRAWQVAFGSDSTVIGRLVPVNGAMTRVIGVMPEGYGFPGAADAWVPLDDTALAVDRPGVTDFNVYARLAPGASADGARSELETLLERARASRPLPDAPAADAAPSSRLLVRSFPMAQLDGDGPLMFAVLNLLAGLILLLACINVTNLLLARANERARETAVRLALGASRGRLVMQSLWESVLLCAAGGASATALAAWGLDAINAWAQAHLEGNLTFWWVWSLNGTTLLVAGGFVTLTLAVLGGVVSMRATSTSLNEVLQDGGPRSGGRREGRVARALVATQVATVSVLMLIGVLSGIVAYRVSHMRVGYDTHHLLSTGIAPPGDRYTTRETRGALFEALYDRMSHRPELDGVVLRASLASIANDAGAFAPVGASFPSPATMPHAYVEAVMGSATLVGAATREGRAIDARDRDGSVHVAVVSEALARRQWPGKSAVGQRIRLAGLGESSRERIVVGVVSDVLKGNPLSRDRSAQAIYIPLRQTDADWVAMIFRYRGDAVAAQVALRQSLTDIDPLIPPPSVTTYDEVLAKSAMLARGVATLFTCCFGFALLLAVSGTYGLMARSIGQRTREIAVRRALGASDRSIVRLLLGYGGRQLGVGALAALPVMLLVGLGFSHYFPIGVAITMAMGVLVATIIVGVVLAATYVPTRKALAMAVFSALRRE